MTTNVPSGASARLEPIDVTSHHRLSAVIFAPLTAESPGAERTPQGTASSLVRLPEHTLSPPPSQLPEQDHDAQQRRLVVGYYTTGDQSRSRNDGDEASVFNCSSALSRTTGEAVLDYDKRMAMS